MAEYNIIKLEDYEEDDALWWCLHHKETLSYLKLRVTQYKNAKTDDEKVQLMRLIDVIIEQK